MEHYCCYSSPIGNLYIFECGNYITRVISQISHNNSTATESATPLLEKAINQLQEYFDGTRKTFNLPILYKGTPFQQSVWEALLTVPYGQTSTYGKIASQIGNSKACRAVGMANNRNPIMIIIPCHRIIGANGSLTGYAGGLDAKRYLLGLEKKYS